MTDREKPVPWYPAKFSIATLHMDFIQRSIYRALLDYSWVNGPLPENEDELAALIGCSRELFRAGWPIVRRKFVRIEGGGLINRRLELHRRIVMRQQQRMSHGAGV